MLASGGEYFFKHILSGEALMENRTVLFVDDEENIRKSIERVLRREQYRRLYASNGLEAQEIIKRDRVCVIVTDMQMPGMDGLTLLNWVKKENPDIIRMVLSMKADTSTILEALNSGNIYRYIIKPWEESELATSIRQSLELYNLREEKQRLMNELEEYNRTLEQRVEERTNQLLAINSEAEIGKHTSQIVHNLNNFINNIQGALGLLGAAISGKNPDIDKAREFYNFTVSSVDSLAKIVAEILIRSREKDTRKDENIDINQLIEKELLFWDMNPTYKYKINKEFCLDKNLPSFKGSPIQIKQILDNLIKNSIDAMEEVETRQLSIRTKHNGESVLIEISDTGQGISDENISKVFSPGYTSKPIGKGTGLGLASVKTMVEAYAGTIEIKSKSGEGTTVSIQLPVQ